MNSLEIGTKVNLFSNNCENAENIKASFKDATIVKKLGYDRFRVQVTLPEGAEIRDGWEYCMEYKTDFGSMQANAVVMTYDIEEKIAYLELRLFSDFEPYEVRRHYRYTMKKEFSADIIDFHDNVLEDTVKLNLVDISCSGFRAISNKYIEPKQILHIKINFDKGDNFDFKTEVIGTKKARNYEDSYELRCKFLNSDLKNELDLLKVIFDMSSE